MKKFSLLLFYCMVGLLFGKQLGMFHSVSADHTLNGYLNNPAFLASEEDFGFLYKMDYDTDNEQLFAFRFPKYFGFARDFQRNFNVFSGGVRTISDIYLGAQYFAPSKGESEISLSALYRPKSFLSAGIRVDDALRKRPDIVYGVSIRPFGDWLTIYGQQELMLPNTEEYYQSKLYYGGVKVRALPGLFLGASYNNEERFEANFTMHLAHFFGGSSMIGDSEEVNLQSRQFIGYSFYENEPIRKIKRKVVELEISGDYTEHGFRKHSFEKNRYFELLKELDVISRQASVRKLLLKIYTFDASLAQLQEIRDKIIAFSKNGEVICYTEDMDMKTYYLASIANQIIVPGSSEITLNDFVPQEHFYQFFLQKHGVEMNTYKMGKYEGAPEKIGQQTFSDDVKEQRLATYNEITDLMIEEIASSRSSTPEKIREGLKKAPMTAYDALDCNLVDAIGFEEEARHYLIDFKSIRKSKFKTFPPSKKKSMNWQQEDEIAVLFLDGSLFKGSSFQTMISHPIFGNNFYGVQDFEKQLSEAMNSKSVKAIVLRMNSSGGQIGAIEKIWNLVFEANRKKPIIISIAGNATGGGYYISTAGDYIFAEETSLVGGIGVSGYHWNFDETFARQGIQTNIYDRGFYQYNAINGRSLTDKEKTKFNAVMSQYYQQYVAKVSASRNQTLENVEFVARGKVLSGISAKKYGLIDEFGGLSSALLKAKEVAKIPDNAPVKIYYNSEWKRKWNSLDLNNYKRLMNYHFFYHSGINSTL